MDSNPRHFFLDVTAAEANVDADQSQDFVTIEFSGLVTPTIKKRLEKAIQNGEFELTVKRLLA
jgi:precorrin-3B methylase